MFVRSDSAQRSSHTAIAMDRQRSAARPDNLSMRPPLDGVIQVDNVASVLSTFSQHAAPDHALGQEMQHSPGGTQSSDDGPAPLRRNQACLQVRWFASTWHSIELMPRAVQEEKARA